ncbi:MAG: beta-aspartyl-peptidase [Sutterella wadsworthensis]
MAILIKNARVFAPKDLGVVDVLMANERILAVGKDLAPNLPDLQTVEAGGMIMTPGFFDQHIHVTGGGGEGGPATRTPELVLSELVACGTTDVVGVSGTDYTTRSIPNLLAKVRALQAEGVSAWMYTSNYRCPPTLLTDSIGNDLFFIPEVLGVKIALGDHRSSFPDVQTVLSMLADIRVGAMLAGKIGFLHIHNGNIPGAFAMYEEIVSRGFPVKHIRPTHCGRIRHVFDSAVQFALKGGWIDITTGASCCFDHPAQAVVEAIAAGVDPTHITLSDRRSRFRAPLQRQGRNGRPRRGRRGRKPQGNHPSHPRSQHADRTGPHVHDLERRRRPRHQGPRRHRDGRLRQRLPLHRGLRAQGRLRPRPRNDARR